MHMIDRTAFAAHAELEAIQGRDPAETYADPLPIDPAVQKVMDDTGMGQMQAYRHVQARRQLQRQRPAPRPCGICNGDHSTVICQMSGEAPRPRPKLSLFKR